MNVDSETVIQRFDCFSKTLDSVCSSDSQPQLLEPRAALGRLLVILFTSIINLLKINLFRTVYVNFIEPFFIPIVEPMPLKQ